MDWITKERAGTSWSPARRALAGVLGAALAMLAHGPSRAEADPARLMAGDATPAEAPLGPTLQREPSIAPLLDTASQLRLQVLVAIPEEGPNGPTLRRLGYRVDAEYFYPASAIKLCAGVAALEQLSAMRADGAELTAATPLRIRSASGGFDELDPSDTVTGKISIGQEIRKALIVSDNDAFNRLFSFVGHDALNTRLSQDGFASTRLRHFLGTLGHDARRSPRIELLPAGRSPVVLPERHGTLDFTPNDVPRVLVGKAHLDAQGRRVDAPMSFEDKNRISLRDLQDLLVAVVRPDLAAGKTVQLDPEDRALLVRALETLPSESKNPSFSADAQLDELHKPLVRAVRKAAPGHRIRAFGKGGRAYGFVIQNSYLMDETTGRSAFVSATLYTNANHTMNDDQYEYDKVAAPFVQGLGELAAREFLATPRE